MKRQMNVLTWAVILIFSGILLFLSSGCQSDQKEIPEQTDHLLNMEEEENTYQALDPIDRKLDEADAAYDRKDYQKAKELLNSLKGVKLSFAQQFFRDNIAANIEQAENTEKFFRTLNPDLKAARREYKAGNWDSARKILIQIDFESLSVSEKEYYKGLLSIVK